MKTKVPGRRDGRGGRPLLLACLLFLPHFFFSFLKSEARDPAACLYSEWWRDETKKYPRTTKPFLLYVCTFFVLEDIKNWFLLFSILFDLLVFTVPFHLCAFFATTLDCAATLLLLSGVMSYS